MIDVRAKEKLRKLYKPCRVKLLFVGESVPASGKFFYQGDSNLFIHTKEAFRKARLYVPTQEEDFLSVFSRLGCYLVDLCDVPVNGKEISDRERREARCIGVPRLAGEIETLDPAAVLVRPLMICKEVKKALALAGRESVPFHSFPFPARCEQNKIDYEKQLSAILCEFVRQGLIGPL